jgi:hypothetical protein
MAMRKGKQRKRPYADKHTIAPGPADNQRPLLDPERLALTQCACVPYQAGHGGLCLSCLKRLAALRTPWPGPKDLPARALAGRVISADERGVQAMVFGARP